MEALLKKLIDEDDHVNKTTIEVVLQDLRKRILNGDLPPSSRLHVEKLRKEFKVGVSTIREALSRLLVETLVTTEGQRGFWVTPISNKDLVEVSEMRKHLEAIAIRRSIENGDDEWEAEIVSSFHLLSREEARIFGADCESTSRDTAKWSKLNREFHASLVAASDNTWLLSFRKSMLQQSERYIQLSVRNASPKQRDVSQDHKEIFDAVMARDANLAIRLLDLHIDQAVSIIRESFGSDW